MKSIIAISVLILLFNLELFSQERNDLDILHQNTSGVDEKTQYESLGRAFFAYGDLAEKLMAHPNLKGRKGNYVLKVKNIEGISSNAKIRLSEGFRNKDGNAHWTFGTKYYQPFQKETLPPDKEWGFVIHVSKAGMKHEFIIDSPEEEKAFIDFLARL